MSSPVNPFAGIQANLDEANRTATQAALARERDERRFRQQQQADLVNQIIARQDLLDLEDIPEDPNEINLRSAMERLRKAEEQRLLQQRVQEALKRVPNELNTGGTFDAEFSQVLRDAEENLRGANREPLLARLRQAPLTRRSKEVSEEREIEQARKTEKARSDVVEARQRRRLELANKLSRERAAGVAQSKEAAAEARKQSSGNTKLANLFRQRLEATRDDEGKLAAPIGNTFPTSERETILDEMAALNRQAEAFGAGNIVVPFPTTVTARVEAGGLLGALGATREQQVPAARLEPVTPIEAKAYFRSLRQTVSDEEFSAQWDRLSDSQQRRVNGARAPEDEKLRAEIREFTDFQEEAGVQLQTDN